MAKTASPFSTTEFKGGAYTSSYYNPAASMGINSAYATSKTSNATAVGGVDPLNLRGAVNDLLGFQGDYAQYTAAAAGSRFDAEGAAIEADAYRIAGGIAGENLKAEQQAENVRQIQLTRQIEKTAGSISAATASNNLQMSGSAVDVMAASMKEGYLAQQISTLSSAQAQRGYLEQAAAAEGQMKAAQVRGEAALSLAGAQDAAAASALANQTALSGALTQLLSGDENATQLVSDLTAGDIAAVQADVLLYNPNGADQPLVTAEPPVEERPSLGVFPT